MSNLVVLIPARKGSKGLPNKNRLPLLGLPLVEHSIVFAQRCKLFSRIIVSTDCPDILSRSFLYPDVTFLHRPDDLAQDTSSLIDVIAHVADCLSGIDVSSLSFCLLQPTSPFRSTVDMRSAVEAYSKSSLSPLVSVARSHEHYCETVLRLPGGEWKSAFSFESISGRQQYPCESFFITGSFYFATFSFLLAHRSFIAPGTCYHITSEPLTIDIDCQADYDLACAVAHLPIMRNYVYPFL